MWRSSTLYGLCIKVAPLTATTAVVVVMADFWSVIRCSKSIPPDSFFSRILTLY